MRAQSKSVVILSEAKDLNRFTIELYFCAEILRASSSDALRMTPPLPQAEASGFPFDFQLSTFDSLHS
jgi:hypothetical protein